MEWTEANSSTVAVFIWMVISPFINKLGFNWDSSICIGFITVLVGLGIARWSAINPNTLKIFDNHKETICTDDVAE